MEHNQPKRDFRLDIIRIFAFFCVVSVHYFLYSRFYRFPMAGPQMFFAAGMRSFFMICVPLFPMLSGYLMNTKRPTRQYYVKLGILFLEYALASLFCMVYQAYEDGNLPYVHYYIYRTVFQVFSYDAAPYGWYMEMYIGLFLLIPYLNMIYHGLPDKKGKQGLLLTLLFLCAVPSLGNNLFLKDVDDAQNIYYHLFPQWWSQCYPLCYYFLGSYLKEYPLQLRKRTMVALIAVVFVTCGALEYVRNYGREFSWSISLTHESLPVVILTVLVFSLLLRIPNEKISSGTGNFLSRISGLCFSAYLVSSIFDSIFYPLFKSHWRQDVYQIGGYPILVPLVFVCSLMLASVVTAIHRLVIRVLTMIFSSLSPSKT